MESKGENTNVDFQKEPKFFVHEVQREFNERRTKLVAEVKKDFIPNHPRFRGKEFSITYSHKGVSSLVCKIETSEERMVLKVRLGTSNNGEAQFLKVWEKEGITVPT